MEGWYGVGTAQLRAKGGDTLVAHYGCSIIQALEAVYPFAITCVHRNSTHWYPLQ